MSRHVWAHIVARDETHRYLECMLTALAPHVDDIHVYDDGSTDDTPRLALALGATVSLRVAGTPHLPEDEAACRQAAWDTFVLALAPADDDWVLAIDADELLVAPTGLSGAIEAAHGAVAVVLPIPEVFGIVDSVPMIRVDGFWGDLDAPRLLCYRPGGAFRAQQLAGGSVPYYAQRGVQSRENAGVQLLHLGYADPADRWAKYQRYAGRPGHSAAHLTSITRPPRLEPWAGPPVDIWRGRR